MSKGVQFLFKKNKIDAIMGSAHIKANRIVEVTDADGKVRPTPLSMLFLPRVHAQDNSQALSKMESILSVIVKR